MTDDGEAISERTAERVGRNDAMFRAANERVRDAAVELDEDGAVPFLCECADPHCTSLIPLRLADYEAIRADPTHFLNVPGHERSAQGWATVVRRMDGYVVVEKIGRAAEVAAELDPRELA